MPLTSRTFRLAIALMAGTTAWSVATGRTGTPAAQFTHFTYKGMDSTSSPNVPDRYRNPILAGYYPDPSVLRVGDDYYLVNSSFSHFPGIPVWHSRDLVDWHQIGNAIDRPDQLDLTGRAVSEGVFAPDISFHAGRFYLINTCVGCGGNYVITADDPAGPWSRPIWLPFDGIDPSLYWEGDRAFIVNTSGSDLPPAYDGHNALWLQEYDWRAGRLTGPRTKLVDGGIHPAERPAWIEGPHLFRRDGWYYLMAAEGGTAERHSEVIFRSRTLAGPYEARPVPILTQRDLPPDRPDPVTSTGHADLIETTKGDWWAVFLGTRPYAGDLYLTGRETFLLPVTWAQGWPTILPPGTPVPLTVARPALPPGPAPVPPTSGSFDYVDDFQGNALSPAWVGIRVPKHPFLKVAHDTLSLGSAAPLGERSGVPAFVGRRLQHRRADISVTVRFDPAHDGDRAGLAAIQNDRSFLFFGTTRINGKPQVALYARDKADADTLLAAAPFNPARPVTFTLRINGGTIACDYLTGGARHTLKAGLDAALLSTARAGGFVGTVVGPYAYHPRP